MSADGNPPPTDASSGAETQHGSQQVQQPDAEERASGKQDRDPWAGTRSLGKHGKLTKFGEILLDEVRERKAQSNVAGNTSQGNDLPEAQQKAE
jgi:hypothetical protein